MTWRVDGWDNISTRFDSFEAAEMFAKEHLKAWMEPDDCIASVTGANGSVMLIVTTMGEDTDVCCKIVDES